MSRPNSYIRRRDHTMASSVIFDSLCLEQHIAGRCRKAASAPKVTSSEATQGIHKMQVRSCGLQEQVLTEKTTQELNTTKVTRKPYCKLIDESPASAILFDCLGLESARTYRAGLKKQHMQPRSMPFNPRSMAKTSSLIGASASNTSTMDTLPLAPGALNSLVKNYSLPREVEDHSSSGSQSDGSTSTCNEASDCEMLD